MSNTPLDTATKKAKSRKNYIVASVMVFLALVIMAYIYARAVVKGPETLRNNGRTPTSTITQPASTPKSTSKEDPISLGNDAPAKRVAEQQERIAKDDAKSKGESHIDSTASIKEKTAVYTAASTAPKLPEPPKPKVTTKASSDTKAPEQTREQIIANRISVLFAPNPALPPTPNYTSKVTARNSRIDKIEIATPAYEKASSQLNSGNENNDTGAITPNRPRSTASINQAKHVTEQSNVKDKPEEKQKLLVFSLGQMVLTELRWQVVSDYNLPVFFDVVEPPYKKMVFMGNFEMTPRQDGVLLRVSSLQLGDEVHPISGYGVNISTDLQPLFDDDVDTHFMERFLARASTAFIAPWIDFVGGSTTTVDGGTTIIVKDPITATKDRVMGGIANVAHEFLPDLRKNANIPPTVKIPDGHPVGIVFTSQIYLPKALLEKHAGSAHSSIIGEY
ncbi:TPA: hypothetical protein ACGUU0_003170 [Vibrio vulnificus]